MHRRWVRLIWTVPLALPLVSGFDLGGPRTDVWAAPPLYWCPNQSADQQYGATPAPGCVPLVDEKKEPGKKDKSVLLPTIKIENLQSEASAFLDDHRRYLRCCASDPDSLDDLEALQDRATAILKTAQSGLFSEKMKLRGFTLSEVIPPVARARDQLHEIKLRLEHLATAKDKLDQSNDEGVGRERHQIEALEESLSKDFVSKPPVPSAKTGTEIGQTPPSGPQIGKVPPTGEEFGTQGRTGRDLGYTPPTTGKDIGQNAPTGFEIGRTGVAGPAIGDSDLDKKPSGVSSTLGGSSVGSNLNSNPLGSNLSPSRIDSDLRSRSTPPSPDIPLSTIDSTLKNRSTQ